MCREYGYHYDAFLNKLYAQPFYIDKNERIQENIDDIKRINELLDDENVSLWRLYGKDSMYHKIIRDKDSLTMKELVLKYACSEKRIESIIKRYDETGEIGY